MALLRAAPLPAEPAPCWLPTHVQVTAVRARGLRCKGGGGGGGSTGPGGSAPAAGPGDVYAVLELGRQRQRTAVAERSGGSAEWRDGCALELPPGPGSPPVLTVTVLQRALLGADRFLGRCSLALPCPAPPGRAAELGWHKLHSKAGKKEKERGEVEVSVQFTRTNLTASMFDLSVKDKPRSPFGKLKDKVKGKKKYDLESASAIIPSSVGALDGEDDFDVGGKKSKIKGFLKGKLRKSSLTQSNTSLGSDSTISSASLGPAASAAEVTKSPSRHSSLSTERSVRDFLPSPRLTHKRAFSDDVSQVSPVLEPKAIQSLKPKSDPVSRSSLCINGSHVYGDEPALQSPVPAPRSSAPLPVPGGPRRPEEGFGFAPLHPEPPEAPWGGFERTQQRDEPRFIPSPPSLVLQEELKVSTKAVTLSNHLGRARMEESGRSEGKPTQAAVPSAVSAEARQEKRAEETRKEEKKPKGGFFHHGGAKSDAGGRGQGEKTGGSPAAGDERSRAGGWFASKEPKESPQKPSFPPGPHASTEVAGSLCSSADCSPSASLRLTDPEREPPAQNVGVPVPETTPPSHGDLPPPPPDERAAAGPPPLSEWDATFDAFATSRLNPEPKKENVLASVAAAEGMAFIDDPDAASPADGSAEKGAKAFEKAEPQIGSEMPPALRSWTNFSGLDVGANLVSTTQEATVIEDVLSPVSAGSGGRRRKSSTPMVWAPAFSSGNAGEKEASAARTGEKRGGEDRDSNEEETSGAGENGWMTIATETASDPSESTQSIGQESAFGQRPFLSEGTFEAKSGPRAAACVLPRSKFPPEAASETLPGGNVAAVPPRVLPEAAVRRFPAAPEPGRDPQGAGGQEETFDIRTSVYRLQASMRLEAGEGRVRLSSDVRERHVVLSPWTGVRGEQEEATVPGSDVSASAPPPKPPRWFAAAGGRGDGEEEACDPEARRQGGEERREGVEGLKGDVEPPRRRPSGETAVPAPPSPAAPRAATAEAAPEIPASGGAEGAATDSEPDAGAKAAELAEGDTPLGTDPSEMSGEDAAEKFETCPSKLSLESWSRPALPPLSPGPAGGAEVETAAEQERLPEELSVSGLTPSSRLDSGQPEAFWTAVEEQEAAGCPQRLARGHSPPRPEPAWGHGAGRRGQAQGRPSAGEPEGPRRRCSADGKIDFKKADFWKPEAEERSERDASVPGNPFVPAVSPIAPSNPFAEKPPDSLPVRAVLPERLAQGFGFPQLPEEALQQGFQPANLPREPLGKPPSLHASQPLAFSTPFLVAATNPERFEFPSPVACPASGGVPAATSRAAAAQPCPLLQSGDTQASALVVLPRETQPAEKPFCQQTTSPHPVKPISAAVQEAPGEKKQQQHKSGLTAALSNGLEKLKTVTTGSIQPVAPSSQPEKADSKKLKDPAVLDQSAKYYHLTHDELIQLLLQKEKELSKKEEHIQELENYIDQLLVRIMEQSPTLLQIPLGEAKTK
ncbi:rab11 family-interacting protein 5 isoform X1 [Anser cygnoides]|uniref:rab11 family-interacting protein 5 isoform X1 n=1 Tax=Anser cygnoides TaxID=8845 RepID=UPI0034D21870